MEGFYFFRRWAFPVLSVKFDQGDVSSTCSYPLLADGPLFSSARRKSFSVCVAVTECVLIERLLFGPQLFIVLGCLTDSLKSPETERCCCVGPDWRPGESNEVTFAPGMLFCAPSGRALISRDLALLLVRPGFVQSLWKLFFFFPLTSPLPSLSLLTAFGFMPH